MRSGDYIMTAAVVLGLNVAGAVALRFHEQDQEYQRLYGHAVEIADVNHNGLDRDELRAMLREIFAKHGIDLNAKRNQQREWERQARIPEYARRDPSIDARPPVDWLREYVQAHTPKNHGTEIR